MSIEKVRSYLSKFGVEDRILEFSVSSAKKFFKFITPKLFTSFLKCDKIKTIINIF